MSNLLITGIECGLTGDADGKQVSSSIRIENGVISEMGDLIPNPGEKTLDAAGCVVTPGLINTHHHLFQSILKGVPEGLNLPLDEWLMHVPYTWWPYIDEEALRVSARIGLAELVLSGATTICDHHYIFSDRYDYDPAQVLFEEAARFGVRFVLARGGGTRGRAFDDPALPPPPIENLDAFLRGIATTAAHWHDPSEFAMRQVAVAPTTPTFNVAPGELKEIAQTARSRGLRLHSHLSENGAYVNFTERLYGKRPVAWLAEQDWLGPDVWFAHLVEIDAQETAILAETGTGMAHCPQANARLGSGIAPADALHAAGGCVSLAVDGAAANEAADMGTALYSAFSLHRAAKGVGAARPETVLHWATMGGAQALGLPKCGQIAVGMAGDLTLFDLSSPRSLGLHCPSHAPVLTFGLPVRHSFVAGKPVVEDFLPRGCDLDQLAEDTKRTMSRLIFRRREAQAA